MGLAVTCELVTTDCFGKQVELHHGNWQRHLIVHPEMAPHHDQLNQTLASPDVVIEDPRTFTRRISINGSMTDWLVIIG